MSASKKRSFFSGLSRDAFQEELTTMEAVFPSSNLPRIRSACFPSGEKTGCSVTVYMALKEVLWSTRWWK